MPRTPRIDVGNYVYHVTNRSNARVKIFNTDADYRLIEQLLADAATTMDMRILGYCIMPNHWHLALYPCHDGQLSEFVKWVTQTHTSRWHIAHGTQGTGHIYQGRYKSFIVQTDSHFRQLLRYIERNPVQAKLVDRAEQWKWSSLWRRLYGNDEQKKML